MIGKRTSLGFLTFFLSFSPLFVAAQESLTLSVTPPLFQLSAQPGEIWRSSIKVVNSNQFDLTVFADVVAFEAEGEQGHGKFTPLLEVEQKEELLAGWIDITSDPITIASEESKDVPIVITIPDDAPPGGHFAAILVGTRPNAESGSALTVATSQIVSSLFFVRISGDIKEEGKLREFSVTELFHETPEAEFVLRFENNGNVHLQPQGDITISNMWGKERGFIPINHKTHFGNVLPQSIRAFNFSWSGESSLSDIGRYKAEVTLGYGDDQRKFVDSAAYFWVIPLRGTLITLSVLFAFIAFLVWAIRRYIRRAIYLAGYELDEVHQKVPVRTKQARKPALRMEEPVAVPKRERDLGAPIREGVLDLRSTIKQTETEDGYLKPLVTLLKKYKLFIGSVGVFVISVVLVITFFMDALQSEKHYEVTIEEAGGDLVLSSEEVIKDRIVEEENIVSGQSEAEQLFTLSLVNTTDQPGVGARLALQLEELGYQINDISSEEGRDQQNSVIVYSSEFTDAAQKLSEQLGSVLISTRTEDEQSTSTEQALTDIVIFIGDDRR